MFQAGQKTFKILRHAGEGYCVTVRGEDDGDATIVMVAADPDDEYQAGQKTFKILCRAGEGYCVTVRGGDDGDAAVVMAAADPDDEYQHWYKDMRRSTRVKDEEGYPAFALVNKATGLAIKHSLGQSHPVDLVPYEYDPAVMDLSVLWTQSKDVGDGFRCIRMVSNIYLNFDAFEGEPDVQDGTVVGLWEWNEGGNQCWKILPWGTEADADADTPAPPPAAAYGWDDDAAPQDRGQGYEGGLPPALSSECTVRIFCSAGEEYSVAARDGTVCLAPTDPSDDLQHWVKDMRRSTRMKDEDGYPAFALVNKGTGEAIKHSLGESHPVRLARYDPDYLDESVLWTESEDVGDGFRCVRMVNNIHLNFDALDAGEGQGGVHDGTAIVLWEWCEGENQRWKILPWSE